MPYMERLTWDGAALHAGKLPGYPASHGCVRLLLEFSRELYSVTHSGTHVVIADAHSAPEEIVHPGVIAPVDPGANQRIPGTTTLRQASFWEPSKAPKGTDACPITDSSTPLTPPDTMRNTPPKHLVLALLAAGAVPAFADADGPDFYQVTGVAQGDILNIRGAPKASAAKVGTIPPGGTCIRNLGCQGGLNFQEYQTLSPDEQAVRQKQNPRWCHVEYRGVTGWVAGRYLAEDSCP